MRFKTLLKSLNLKYSEQLLIISKESNAQIQI